MTVEIAPIEVDNQANNIQSQLVDYLHHFDPKMEKEPVIDAAMEIINLNNEFSARLYESDDFKQLLEEEKELNGDCILGAEWCVDGRILRLYFPAMLSSWEVPAGVIPTKLRPGDNEQIPESTDLCEAIRKNFASDYLELGIAHTDTTNSDHGCAAIKLILAALKTEESDMETVSSKEESAVVMSRMSLRDKLRKLLTLQEIGEIGKLSPEDANLLLVKKITLGSITNFLNAVKEAEGRQPLKRVGVDVLFDTATTGLTFKSNGNQLETTELTNKYQEQLARENIVTFGQFDQFVRTPDEYLEFSKKLLSLTKAIINDENHSYTDLNTEITNFIDENYKDLTEKQKQSLRFVVTRTVASQFSTGFAQTQEHPNTDHGETHIAISIRGKFLGKNIPNQQFGCSATDDKEGLSQIKIALSVMDHHMDKGKPRLLYICESISNEDYQSKNATLQTKKAELASFWGEIFDDPDLHELIESGKVVPIPVLIDEKTRKVIEIPKLSGYRKMTA